MAVMKKPVKKAIWMLALPLIGCWLLIAIPGFQRPKYSVAAAQVCKNNLQHISDAKTKWAQEKNRTTNDTPTWTDLVDTNRYMSFRPECPSGGVLTLGRVGEPPKCTVRGHSL